MTKNTECSVADPWFDLIASKKKTVEGRLHVGKFAALKRGDILIINHAVNPNKRIHCHICAVRKYASFQQYLEEEGLNRTLPGVHAIAEGVSLYHAFYSPERASEHGVVAVELSLVSPEFVQVLKEAKRVASTQNRQTWNEDPEGRHMEERVVVSRVIDMIANGRLSCDEAKIVCKPLDRVAKDTSLHRWYA